MHLNIHIKHLLSLFGVFIFLAFAFLIPTAVDAATCQTTDTPPLTVTCYQGPDGQYYEGSSASGDSDYWCQQGYSSYCSGGGSSSGGSSSSDATYKGPDGNWYYGNSAQDDAAYWCQQGYSSYCSGGGSSSGGSCGSGETYYNPSDGSYYCDGRLDDMLDIEIDVLGDGSSCDSVQGSVICEDFNTTIVYPDGGATEITEGDGEPCGYEQEDIYYPNGQLVYIYYTTIPESQCPTGDPDPSYSQSAYSTCPNGQSLYNGQCYPDADCVQVQTGTTTVSSGKNGGTTQQPVYEQQCSCPSGSELVGGVCIPDACTNIDGYQASAPSGYVRVGNQCHIASSCTTTETTTGSGKGAETTSTTTCTCPSGYQAPSGSGTTYTYCVATDVCPNLSGTQASVPSGYALVSGQCEVDVCPNISGAQGTVPSGYSLTGGQCVVNAVGWDGMVYLIAVDSTASEDGDTASYRVGRSVADSSAVTVGLTFAGTAVRNTDYTLSQTTPVTIPANGTQSSLITLTAIDDTLDEDDWETAIPTLAAGSGYTLGVPSNIIIAISDNDVPVVAIAPTITADSSIIRLGEDVAITWDPGNSTNCVLSNNLMSTSPVPSGTVAGSRTVFPTGETSYSIVCDGVGNEDSVTVKVLPRIQET